MSVTLRDVAVKAGVGVSTVSYVLNKTGLHKVSLPTQARICAAARELGYVPNLAGRILTGAGSRMIGMVMPMRMPLIYNEVPSDICVRLRGEGYHVAVDVATNASQREEVISGMLSRNIEGMIFFNCERELAGVYESCPVPILHFDGMDGEIRMDLVEGEYMATRHLIEVHGHRRIGFFTELVDGNQGKYAGYCRALAEAGMSPDKGWLIQVYGHEDWMSLTLEAIRTHDLTALVCSNDNYATALINLLCQHGIRVPDDVAVFGYDGDCYGPYLAVPLSTVVQPMSLLVRRMAELMLIKVKQHILHELEPEMLHPYLSCERSCGCHENQKGQWMSFKGYSLDIRK